MASPWPTVEELREAIVKLRLKASDEKHLRLWEGWVSECVDGYLKDEIPLHTHKGLVVADDKPKLLSKTVGLSWYIPLKRNQDEVVQKGRQFDLRGMLEEFKRKVYQWEHWEPGMEIQVSLVRREQIPSYLFTKANHNELQHAPNRCAVENEVGVDIGRTIA